MLERRSVTCQPTSRREAPTATLRNVLGDLLATPGVEELCELGSRFGFMALHGGNLERGTDTIARAAADRAGASLYAVVQPPDLRWHVPSVAYDPKDSPCLATFLAHVDTVVTVHGYGREGLWATLLVGGRNRPLAPRPGCRPTTRPTATPSSPPWPASPRRRDGLTAGSRRVAPGGTAPIVARWTSRP